MLNKILFNDGNIRYPTKLKIIRSVNNSFRLILKFINVIRATTINVKNTNSIHILGNFSIKSWVYFPFFL